MSFSKWFSKTSKQPDGITLSDIIRGFQFCVNASTEIMEQHYATFIEKYIDDENHPITKRIYLNDDQALDLPLICMAEHSALSLDELNVKMNVTLKDIALKEAKLLQKKQNETNDFTVSRGSLLVDLCNLSKDEDGGAKMEIEMKFKSTVPPEAVSRVLETLNNAIAVKLVGEQ